MTQPSRCQVHDSSWSRLADSDSESGVARLNIRVSRVSPARVTVSSLSCMRTDSDMRSPGRLRAAKPEGPPARPPGGCSADTVTVVRV